MSTEQQARAFLDSLPELTPEEKHYWEVELPDNVAGDKDAANEIFKRQGLTSSWFEGYEGAMWVSCDWYFLEPPSRPCRRIIRLALPNDGQLRVVHEYSPWHKVLGEKCDGDQCLCRRNPVTQVNAYSYYTDIPWRTAITYETGKVARFSLCTEGYVLATVLGQDEFIHRYRGTIQKTPCREGDATALVFGARTPQTVADDAVRIITESQEPENFYALLDGGGRCSFCCKPLRDEVSKLVEVGPDCAKKYGIPHTLEAASKRLELRKTLLAGLEVRG